MCRWGRKPPLKSRGREKKNPSHREASSAQKEEKNRAWRIDLLVTFKEPSVHATTFNRGKGDVPKEHRCQGDANHERKSVGETKLELVQKKVERATPEKKDQVGMERGQTPQTTGGERESDERYKAIGAQNWEQKRGGGSATRSEPREKNRGGHVGWDFSPEGTDLLL